MNKEKEIEQMAKTIELIKLQALNTVGSLNKGYGMFYAEHLASAGYGNIKQAVKEFAEKLKLKATHYCEQDNDIDPEQWDSVNTEDIDNLITELYGADE